MAEELFQVRNHYVDQRFNGFVLKAGKKAVVRVGLEFFTEDFRRGAYRMHHGVISRDASGRYALLEHLALPLG